MGIPVGGPSHQYYDVSRDGIASPIDALTVINYLGRHGENSDAEWVDRLLQSDPNRTRRKA